MRALSLAACIIFVFGACIISKVTVTNIASQLGNNSITLSSPTTLAPTSADEYELALLDAFDTRELPPDGHVLGTDG